MNNEAYTSYPSESEILLRDGAFTYILGVEEDIVIQNDHTSFAKYNGKTISIVHLFIKG